MSGESVILSRLLSELRAELVAAGIDDAATDARSLICGILGVSLTDIVLHGERAVSSADVSRVRAALVRRKDREPVHRILGHRSFRGLDLALSPDTLEPRPDTEVLVEAVLPVARKFVQAAGRVSILDLGTGTGAICLALLDECPQATGTGVDISRGALETAAANAVSLGLSGRFSTVESDWFDKIDGCFDIIVSNPPYIRSSVIGDLAPEVRRFDPAAALDGGPDGLDAYRTIADGAGRFLARDGVVALEIGFDQKEQVIGIFESRGFVTAGAFRDYGDNDRALVFART